MMDPVEPDIVRIESEIPPGHPEKGRIEDVLRATLAGLPGKWRVRIVCSHIHVWWVVVIEGPQLDWVGLLADASEQTADFVAGRIGTMLRSARRLE
jgi:hypothetical protein